MRIVSGLKKILINIISFGQVKVKARRLVQIYSKKLISSLSYFDSSDACDQLAEDYKGDNIVVGAQLVVSKSSMLD